MSDELDENDSSVLCSFFRLVCSVLGAVCMWDSLEFVYVPQ